MKQIFLGALLMFSTSRLTLAIEKPNWVRNIGLYRLDLISESLSRWFNRFPNLQGRSLIIFTGNPSHPLVLAFRQAEPNLPVFTPNQIGEMRALFPTNPLLIVIGSPELASTGQNIDPLALYVAAREGRVLPLLSIGQHAEQHLPVFLRTYHTIQALECSAGIDLLVRSVLRAMGETNNQS